MDVRKLKREIAARLVARIADRELREFLERRLPRLGGERDPKRWIARSRLVRERLLSLLFRGHPSGLLHAEYPIEWRETLEPGTGYRIRKLRYEGYPGLWVPALLYEPSTAGFEAAAKGGASGPNTAHAGAARRRGGTHGARIKIPAVLNPDGHHAGGMAMAYKQARCINLAKRGMLALNFEFLGMGELSASRQHNRIAHLDLVGVEGAGVFYLVMKRALDILLSHPSADHDRVAMTGLSGGGWQTITLSSLDQRITASIPVAGYTAVWQRMYHPSDVGDMEQLPVDFCTAADYDVLSAMLAPRPTLFIFNHDDECCFATPRTRPAIVEPARRYFSLLDAADKVEMHDNRNPGTHNYEADNRSRLYAFLNRHFGLTTPDTDLPWEKELYSEEALSVGLPENNETPLSLAAKKARELAAARRTAGRQPVGKRVKKDVARSRGELRRLLRMPPASTVSVRRKSSGRIEGIAISQLVARIDGWSVPLVHVQPPARRQSTHPRRLGTNAALDAVAPAKGQGRPEAGAGMDAVAPAEGAAAFAFKDGEVVLAVDDWDRRDALERALARCRGMIGKAGARPGPTPAHILAADLFGTGELRHHWQKHMLVNAAGARPLGIQVEMIHSLARWMRGSFGGAKVSLQAGGIVCSVAALIAAALEPSLFSELSTDSLPPTLACLIEWPMDYESAPPLFCFGLLERFDIPDLIRLCGSLRVRDVSRGPLQ